MKRWSLVVSLLGALGAGCTTPPARVEAQMAQKQEEPRAAPAAAEAKKTDAQWREELTPAQYRVLREQGTEPPFTGQYWNSHEDAVYVCAACGNPLFDSRTKYESGTGWPSFYQPVKEGAVETTVDRSHGMTRVEVHCARCGGHLGHIFEDGPDPTGLRYCINSVSLDQVERKK